MWGRVRSAAVVLVLVAMAVAPAALSAPPGPALPPGCAADRVATAYRSDGRVETASGAPVVCWMYTGFGGAETHIRVGPSGEVIEDPAIVPSGLPGQINGGLASTTDEGRTWDLIQPAPKPLFPAQDSSIHIDPANGRLFLAIPTGFGASLAGELLLLSSPRSSAGYVQWASTTMHGFAGTENPRYASARPRPGQAVPVPGEQVTYFCGNQNPAGTSPPILDRICFRSLDGGVTWTQRSILFTAGAPRHSECGGSAENFGALDGNYPQAASDGSLWVTVDCGGKVFLARSTDGAASFPILHRNDAAKTPYTVPFSAPSGGLGTRRELRIDPDGNLYAAETDGAALLLRVSRDGGLTWTAPRNMTAPSARRTDVYQWQLAVRSPGQVAASYLTPHAGGGYDGYVTVTADALDDDPLFHGAMVNSPQAPMVTLSSAGDDFIDVDLGPDGTPWAAFYSDCPTDGSVAFCAQTQEEPVQEGNTITGPQAETVARLVWPDGATARRQRR